MTVIEGNIDASEQCYDSASCEIRNGNLEKAEKLLNRALKLYPKNSKAEALLLKLQKGAFDKMSASDSSSAARKRSSATSTKKADEPKLGEDYTQEHVDVVTNLKKYV